MRFVYQKFQTILLFGCWQRAHRAVAASSGNSIGDVHLFSSASATPAKGCPDMQVSLTHRSGNAVSPRGVPTLPAALTLESERGMLLHRFGSSTLAAELVSRAIRARPLLGSGQLTTVIRKSGRTLRRHETLEGAAETAVLELVLVLKGGMKCFSSCLHPNIDAHSDPVSPRGQATLGESHLLIRIVFYFAACYIHGMIRWPDVAPGFHGPNTGANSAASPATAAAVSPLASGEHARVAPLAYWRALICANHCVGSLSVHTSGCSSIRLKLNLEGYCTYSKISILSCSISCRLAVKPPKDVSDPVAQALYLVPLRHRSRCSDLR